MTALLDLPADHPFGAAALPYGVADTDDGLHVVTRLGEHVIDLVVLEAAGGFVDVGGVDDTTFRGRLDALLAAGRATWSAVRARLVALASGAVTLPDHVWEAAATPAADATLVLPVTVADYVDFYCSINHATNMGRILRPTSEPLLPNWRHLPIGYHGRSGSIVVDGTDVTRPNGLRPGEDGPTFGPTRRMDFELEVGMVVGTPAPLGTPVAVDDFDAHVFGLCLVNDWSARDIQGYEYQPLGPFLGKSFLTSVAPWVVPLEALAPALAAAPAQEPVPADYLRGERDWAIPIALEVRLQTAAMRAAGEPAATVAVTDFVDMYWTMAQMLAHCTVNGAGLRTGDLYASGTVSGTEPGTYGSMMELSWGGQQPLELPNGETRTFLEDGDTLTLGGVTTLPDGRTVGFGTVTGTVLPARGLPGATA